ncbi:hypothetical protein [Pararhizobium sp. A13]|uniref:hypothetical protein n=1 Tax=Pararhizobium sp. A13 TaxID=3133975 RepID=UPI00324B2423
MIHKTSKRKTSKVLLGVNTLLAWGAIFYAIALQQAAVVVASLVGIIALSYGVYVGVGHMDYRAHLKSLAGAVFKTDSQNPQD